ncbi:MAG: alpha-2-macroglobulin family protein [Acidithiobacillales bacterium]
MRRAAALAAFPLTAALALTQQRSAPPPPAPTPQPAAVATAAPVPSWKELDRLVAEQKLEEAARMAATLRAAARARGDAADETKALVREVQLREALHGYETAVRYLKEEPWPRTPEARSVLNLFYADALVTYARADSWEIGQREKVETRGTVDLKAWTREQITAEAARAFVAVWKEREALGRESVETLSDFVAVNDYPRSVRGTVRDAVSYLFVGFLADTGWWRPGLSSELYTLDLGALVAGSPGTSRSVRLDDPAVHPLVRIGAILDDLEAWHRARGEREAELEARLERLRRLSASFTDAKDREAIREDLARRLPAFRDVAWWAMGQGDLAEMARAEESPDALVRARALALEGAATYPESAGGRRCRSIAAGIEAPDVQLASMSSDGPQKRSIEVTHRNLPALFFRAYPFDLEERLARARDYNLLPAWRELAEFVERGTAAAEWRADLPATPDYRSHRTFVTPPLDRPGAYVVIASARMDFAKDENRILGVHLLVTGLVMAVRQTDEGGIEARVVSGETGAPVPGAAVSLWRFDWQAGHRRVLTKSSGPDGLVSFDGPAGRSDTYFVVARKGPDVALDPAASVFFRRSAPEESTSALIYTDRSVYRPLQKILWKAVVYRGREARWATLPEMPVNVSLHDANGQAVETRSVKTNSYGTAAGEFSIPAGRLLGAWSIRTSVGGGAGVRVEEYKRPTFDVTLKEPAAALRLNRPATLRGEARYYFGLPVANGSVRWRVTRETVRPWWCWWLWRAPAAQTVAAGTSRLREDGTFELTFTPKADERGAGGIGAKELTWRYAVAADVTDDGGETRSAARSFRLGFVAVEARVEKSTNFFLEGNTDTVTVVRTDLDGTPRPGNGSWRLVRLMAPEKTILPADFPSKNHEDVAIGAGDANEPGRAPRTVQTPGDRLRPRWETEFTAEEWMRTWPEGTEAARGSVEHDARGEARLDLGKLPAGAYRLAYETEDEFGGRFNFRKDLLVVSATASLPLPALLLAESSSVPAGGTARFAVLSGIPGATLYLDVVREGRLAERRVLKAGTDPSLLEIPVMESDRGGLALTLTVIRDDQLLRQTASVFVPWDDRELKLEFATFRDRLRPGAKETWRVKVKGSSPAHPLVGSAELLAYMYDRSLDFFAPHNPPSPLSLYPTRMSPVTSRVTLGKAQTYFVESHGFGEVPAWTPPRPDRLKFEEGYGIGGPGRRGGVVGGVPVPMPMKAARSDLAAQAPASVVAEEGRPEDSLGKKEEEKQAGMAVTSAEGPSPVPLRSDFSETAFFLPHLLTGPDGSATIEFTVPDSVTSWNVWIHAVTRDLRGGSVKRDTRSVKELMVRPYLPRFLREGDEAELRVLVNDAGEQELSGRLTLDILDPETNRSLLGAFGVPAGAAAQPFTVRPGGGTSRTFRLKAPVGVKTVAFKVVATAGDLSDGELRPLPVLPGRMHLVESRFVTLKERDRKTLRFADLAALAEHPDPTLVSEQMVVTVDAQLFFSVLKALPYLVNFPYECTEQTLNRFVSTGIVSSLYRDDPAVARMASEFSKRETRLETWDAADPNRKMELEEMPWLAEAKGGEDTGHGLVNVLDPRIARAHRDESLAKLRKAQTGVGGFPWWPGGPPSPYMTLYILHGFARAAEFHVEVPKDVVRRAWGYIAGHYRSDWSACMAKDGCWEYLTFLNYVASSFPDDSWSEGGLTPAERKEILAFTFRNWRQHSPYLKGYLALTLSRMGRRADAKLVWDSVMDSAKTNEEEGTFWAPEDRSWLWYNDTVETQAFALRTLMELSPSDRRAEGLVQWLLLNKKLNQWKSTRATAEAIYALVQYLRRTGALGIPEDATVTVGNRKVTFTFEPDRYTGEKNRIVIPGEQVDPKTTSTVVVEKEGKGFVFASAAWHFSTEKLPAEERGDFFRVSRHYFRRDTTGPEAVLRPLADGTTLSPGDEVEVQISLRTKHEAEYVHLRDPRGAGFEPVGTASGWKWDLGLPYYEEVRDSATNYFFERLPVGEYTFKYRVRAAMGGTFKVGPATVQSMYAPEFNAFSAGAVLSVSEK